MGRLVINVVEIGREWRGLINTPWRLLLKFLLPERVGQRLFQADEVFPL